MGDQLTRKVLQIGGMTCTGCETRIENVVKKIDGVSNVKAIYSSSNVYLTYDAGVVGLDRLVEEIEKLDYKVLNFGSNGQEETPGAGSALKAKEKAEGKMSVNQLLGIGIILFALYMVISKTIGFNFIPQVNQNMGYGILFVVGLITSLHCIAMCGGINLSQCVSYNSMDGDGDKLSKLKPSLMYNAGRVLSYTVIGGIVGALGSVVSFSGTAKGIVAIVAGVFMVIMGLNMLNIFPWLRKINPRMPKFFATKLHSGSGSRSPFYVGLLNGLMPCGPLQAMQIYALGTGSFAAGALSMLMFSLGTVPLMFGFGAISSFLGSRFTKKMMKVSAVLVMFLGVIMLTRGLSLSGVNVVYASSGSAGSGNTAVVNGDVQEITTQLQSGSYTPIVVQKGIPVKWTIRADKSNLNGCNSAINIPQFGIQNKQLVPGDNLIEFTPDQEGNFIYTCWMGMIRSNIKVVADVNSVPAADSQQAAADSGVGGILPAAGGCCADSAKATKFAGGKIPTDNIQLAEIKDGQQEVTITVNDEGYSPAVAVVQKGVKTKIKFVTEKLNSCNSTVVFPEYQGQLDLSSQTETPLLTPEQDFTFQCGMNMLHGYVKVVDDLTKVNLDDIRQEVENYKPAAGSSGMSCCG